MTNLAKLQDKLGYQFTNIELLRLAVTHKSATGHKGNYERLEFLGDRVLGLEVASALFAHFKGDDQGALTKRFHALVQQNALASIAQSLDLTSQIITDKAGQARRQTSVLSDVVEAIIAAIYLDGGLEQARCFIFAHIDITATTSDDADANPKSALQEWALGQGAELPIYLMVTMTGPDHAPQFVMRASVASHGSAEAKGPSKKLAEQEAARLLLRQLQKETL